MREARNTRTWRSTRTYSRKTTAPGGSGSVTITVFIVMSIAMFITKAKENETIELNESSPNCILTIRSLSIPSACVRCELFR